MAIIQSGEKKKTRRTEKKRKVWSEWSTPSLTSHSPTSAVPVQIYWGGGERIGKMDSGVVMGCAAVSEASRTCRRVLSGVPDMPTASSSHTSHAAPWAFYTALLHTMSSLPLSTRSAHPSAPCWTSFQKFLPVHTLGFFFLTGYRLLCLVSCKPISHWCTSDVGVSTTVYGKYYCF